MYTTIKAISTNAAVAMKAMSTNAAVATAQP